MSLVTKIASRNQPRVGALFVPTRNQSNVQSWWAKQLCPRYILNVAHVRLW